MVQPSEGKIMATTLWDAKGYTILDQYYTTLVNELSDCIKGNIRGTLVGGKLFHRDNATEVCFSIHT